MDYYMNFLKNKATLSLSFISRFILMNLRTYSFISVDLRESRVKVKVYEINMMLLIW